MRRDITFTVKSLDAKTERKINTLPVFAYFNGNNDRIRVYWENGLFILTKEFNLLRDGKVLISIYEKRKLLFRIQNFQPFTIYILDDLDKFKRALQLENFDGYPLIYDEGKYKQLKTLIRS